MPAAVAERQFVLTEIDRRAQHDLTALWTAATLAADFAAFVTDAFPELVDPWAALAAEFSATWFEESDPNSSYVATTAPLPATQRLVESAKWALGASGSDGLSRLSGTLQRAVYDGSRETTFLNVERTGSRWARHASGTACEFCKLLATRRAAYRSRNTAARDVHDHCHCIPIEVRKGQTYTPPDYARQWDAEYAKAKAEAGTSAPKQVLAAWRQLDAAHSV